MREVLGKVVYHLDEPFANPTSIVQYLLMNQARMHGIKVVLNGHGSDEALGGYGRFIPPFLAQLLLSAHPIDFINNYRKFKGRVTNKRICEEFAAGLMLRIRQAFASRSIPRTDFDSQDTRCVPYSRRTEALSNSRGLSLLASDLWERFATYTLPKWLRMEDRMSMACSIESRLPFMDYRLVEMAFNLPDSLKLDDGLTKVVLRRAMKDRLPVSIASSQTKRRFSSPYGRWLRGEWRPMLEEHLLGPTKLQSHMDTDSLERRLKLFLAGEGMALDVETIWRALNTEMFLQTFAEPHYIGTHH
jgi:asparagine synthase (glutamine-hydrolysing)